MPFVLLSDCRTVQNLFTPASEVAGPGCVVALAVEAMMYTSVCLPVLDGPLLSGAATPSWVPSSTPPTSNCDMITDQSDVRVMRNISALLVSLLFSSAKCPRIAVRSAPAPLTGPALAGETSEKAVGERS